MSIYRLIVKNLYKSYEDLAVLSGLSLTLEAGTVYCLMGPSGIGKTTLLRLILGLEKPDDGEIIRGTDDRMRITAVFQEDRLCETFSPLDNIRLTVSGALSPSQIRAELCRLLPEESVTRPVNTLSGGMKRRVAIARALLTPSDAILMDEPFTGLDEDTKLHVISYIKEKADGRLLLITTHQEGDAALLDAKLLRPF